MYEILIRRKYRIKNENESEKLYSVLCTPLKLSFHFYVALQPTEVTFGRVSF